MTGQSDQDEKHRLIPLTQASALYGFNHAYLATLARYGRLKAQTLGSIWITTLADVEEYIRCRKKVGVFRDDIKASS